MRAHGIQSNKAPLYYDLYIVSEVLMRQPAEITFADFTANPASPTAQRALCPQP
jgi:hypothetical protein